MTELLHATEAQAGQTPSGLAARSGVSEAEVLTAVQRVDDPEYPGVSIVDLGLLEEFAVDGVSVRVGLIPTFSGCPALAMIADDVRQAVLAVPGVEHVDVDWLRSPVWTVDRMTPKARTLVAREFTVAVRIGGVDPACPLCGAPTAHESLFGPSRCRSVSRCTACGETVEVLRS